MHHSIITDIDNSFVDKYLKSRVMTRKQVCKLANFDLTTLRRIIEGERKLTFFAFWKISNVLSINPEIIIKDKDVLKNYFDYLNEYADDLIMPEKYQIYKMKRSVLLSQEFSDMMRY